MSEEILCRLRVKQPTRVRSATDGDKYVFDLMAGDRSPLFDSAGTSNLSP